MAVNALGSGRDQQGNTLSANALRQAPAYIEQLVFASAGAKTLAIPTDGDVVFFGKAGAANFFVKPYLGTGTAPTQPAGTTSDGTGFDANPVAYMLGSWNASDTTKTPVNVQVTADAACTITASFYCLRKKP